MGQFGIGGNVIAVLGPEWRIHQHAHPGPSTAMVPRIVGRGTTIGAVGNSGNAAGRPPQLHDAVLSILQLPWRFSTATQGWKQIFLLDPGAELAFR